MLAFLQYYKAGENYGYKKDDYKKDDVSNFQRTLAS